MKKVRKIDKEGLVRVRESPPLRWPRKEETMAVPKRATASIQPIYCTNCIQCVPMDRPLRSSSLETTEASDTLPNQVSSMTMWFPNCIWNYITLSCALHNKESRIIHTRHRRTKQPHPDLDLQVPFPCKERAESLKTEEKLSS